MYGAAVGDVRMLPTVVIDDRTRRVEPARDRDHAFDESVLTGMARTETGKAHALVDRHPSDDARMVVITPHRNAPLRPRVRHLFPNQQPQPVAPVEPARVFDLLVLAHAVKAEHLRIADVGLER